MHINIRKDSIRGLPSIQQGIRLVQYWPGQIDWQKWGEIVFRVRHQGMELLYKPLIELEWRK